MNDRILTWASTALAVGGAVCSVIASVTEGTATIVLWIVGLVLLVLGVAGLLFAAKKERQANRSANTRDGGEQRAIFARARYVHLLYLGKSKRLNAPASRDCFTFEAYRTEDREALQSFLAGSMSEDRAQAFYAACAVFLPSVELSLQELERVRGKVFFVEKDAYEVMRASEAYRKVFAQNEVVPF